MLVDIEPRAIPIPANERSLMGRGRPLELLFEILCRRRLLRGGRRHAHESRQARNNALRHTTRMQAWVVAVIC